MSNVISLRKRAPEHALERLNRETGLDFSEWPESLLQAPVSGGPATGGAGPLPCFSDPSCFSDSLTGPE